MYRIAYSDAVIDQPSETRAREREAIQRSVELMLAAQSAGPRSRELIAALNFVRDLWTILIGDLAGPQNALPPLLRGQLISVGLSILRQAEDIRLEKHCEYNDLIEISRLIMEGLK